MELWNKKKKVLTGFGIFMALMFLCTLVSRAVYASALPQVTVKTAERKSLDHRVTAEGIVKAGQEYAVTTLPGLRCKTAYVHVGDRITEETLLFEVDTEDLKEQIRQKELEIQKLAKIIETQEYNESLRQAQKDREAYRAEYDYNKLREEEEERGEYNEEEMSDALLEAKRKVQDAEAPTEVDSGREVNQMDISFLQNQLEKYRKLLKAEGKVYGKEEGTITEIFVRPGERIGEGAAIVYAGTDSPLEFCCSLTKEQKRYVNQKDQGNLTLEGKTVEVTVDYVQQNQGNSEIYEMTCLLPEKKGQVHQSGIFEIVHRTELYSCVIPLDALREDSNQRKFVYVLKERSGILGTELIAEKNYVRVLDQNDRSVALEEGSIDNDDEIITDSTKELKDGMVVRYRE